MEERANLVSIVHSAGGHLQPHLQRRRDPRGPDLHELPEGGDGGEGLLLGHMRHVRTDTAEP